MKQDFMTKDMGYKRLRDGPQARLGHSGRVSKRFCHFGAMVALLVGLGLGWWVVSRFGGSYGDAEVVMGQFGAPGFDIKALASLLTVDEKIQLVHGSLSGCGYTGLTRRIGRFSIPELRENDGPQGFRGPRSTSTAYPCAMNMAATFDVKMVHAWSHMMASEFKEKGANMFLGPGLNVARVPANGRNFEYLSGEDPQLGAKMAHASIKGIQSVKGIIATAKHFILNNQETNRLVANMDVDDTTFNEIYLPPFRSAVEAGVLSVMCAYNKIFGTHACENNRTLTEKLRKEWGFKGFVVSDWGGTHSTRESALAGLDQEMPLGVYFGNSFKDLVKAEPEFEKLLTQKAEHVLYAMKEAGLLGEAEPSCLIRTNVTTPERALAAAEYAAAGTVLLKNENNALPILLHPLSKIAVLGGAATDRRIVAGGGSGHVESGDNTIDALSGIIGAVENIEGESESIISYHDGSNASRVKELVEGSDHVVIVLATSAVEGFDRKQLKFKDGDNDLVNDVLEVAKNRPDTKIIVVTVIPGVTLMPWANQVDGLLTMFLPGQGFGLALGRILFGLHNPSGRLPVTIPHEDGQIKFSAEQYPGVNGTSNYTEGLMIGYRWFDQHNVSSLFPFGHGLSYSKFRYHDNPKLVYVPFIQRYYLDLDVTNEGPLPGHEVIQVYLHRGTNCASSNGVVRPPKKLVTFEKIFFDYNETNHVHIDFGFQDIAEWNTGKQKWAWPDKHCYYELWIGPSSKDIRQTVKVKM